MELSRYSYSYTFFILNLHNICYLGLISTSGPPMPAVPCESASRDHTLRCSLPSLVDTDESSDSCESIGRCRSSPVSSETILVSCSSGVLKNT